MGFLSQLNVSNLRKALLSPGEPSCRRFCTNTARLVAAFYLGLPLYDADTYPTLFQWTHLTTEELPGPSISREEMAAALPAEFSARLPVVLLIFCCHDLEAVLYADYFSDRRSSLLLRILVDKSLGLSLTDEYVADWLLGEVARQSSIFPPRVTVLCEQLLPAVLELDIILRRNYIRSLEIHLVDEIELLFAQLPLHSIDVDQLPRPPVYLSPSNVNSPSPESAIISRIHALLLMTLSSLHLTNRISSELRRTINVCSDPEATVAGGRPLLVRLVVIVLSLLYRDSFSLAVHEQWNELPEVAMKYKALIEGDEDDAIGRWHSLADEQDMEHVRLFTEFVKNTYQQQTTLPPLEASTRELWIERICTETPESARESPDWVSGVLQVEKKVSSDAWQQMQYVSGLWRGLSLPDPNLIPLRLYVTADVLCRQQTVPIKLPQSAREQMNNSPRDDRLFMKRSELLEEYTLKAKEDLARRKQETRRKCNTHREPRYMKSTVNSLHIQKIASSQSQLLKEVEAERRFLGTSQRKSPPSFVASSLSASPCSSSSSSPSVKSAGTREDAIRNDIRLLNEKIENIGRMLAEVPIRPTSPPRSPSVVSVEQSPLVYSQMPVASSPPSVEKLDFSLLSPNPSARNPRIPSPDSNREEEYNEEDNSASMDTAKTLSQNNGYMGLLRTQSDRLPLLSYEKKIPQEVPKETSISFRAVTTERAVQTAGMTLGEMKPMARQDISTLYRTRQTTG